MQGLSESDLLLGLIALAVVLGVGRGTAEVARRVGQPEVLGELFGGFLLGPSVLGALLPGAYRTLFLSPPVGIWLSGFAWVGAILVLLVAGLEVDLDLLGKQLRPGGIAAAFAILGSLAVGALFGVAVLGESRLSAAFLGIVVSVTAVSVAAKVLAGGGDSLQRTYAQVILAGGIASEVVVWLLISVAVAWRGGSPVQAGLEHAAVAALFFVGMLTIGRRATFWAMRRVADLSQVAFGQLTLVLILACLTAALTEVLGLHPLLGAFVFGVLLGRAPRSDVPLRERIQTVTTGLFAPTFFVLAGMRVNVFQLGSPAVIGDLLLLFVVATVVKSGLAALGALLGRLPTPVAGLVGVGLATKGGTDVIVAILGLELGLLPTRAYTMYTVVAILTVLVVPPAMAALAKRAPPSPEEQARLDRETALQRSYFSRVERALVPVLPSLLPESAARLLEALAASKKAEGEFFDITELTLGEPGEDGPELPAPDAREAHRVDVVLSPAGEREETELRREQVETDPADPIRSILTAARSHNLVALGARRPSSAGAFSLGVLQDRIIDRSTSDVLVAVSGSALLLPRLRRVLVPVNGLPPSYAAGEVAAYLAAASGATLTLFSAVAPGANVASLDRGERKALRSSGRRVLGELRFRVARLGVRVGERVELAEDPTEAILRELDRRPYDLIVLGAIDRSGDHRLHLGSSIPAILTRSSIPAVLLITHENTTKAPA